MGEFETMRIVLLAHLSFSDQNMSVVRRRCCRRCRCCRCSKLFTVSSSSPEPLGQFQPNTKHPWMMGVQVCSNKGPRENT